MHCTIRIKGLLDTTWSDWFDGVAIRHMEDGTTMLQGDFCDQSALMATLNRLNDLSVTLLSVQAAQPAQYENDKDTTR